MKKFLALILSVAMIFALVACGSKEGDTPNTDGDTQQTDTPAAPVDIVIATGGTTGTYYAVGNALVTTIGDKLSLSKLTAVDSGASKANVQLVTANQAQMSILQSGGSGIRRAGALNEHVAAQSAGQLPHPGGRILCSDVYRLIGAEALCQIQVEGGGSQGNQPVGIAQPGKLQRA